MSQKRSRLRCPTKQASLALEAGFVGTLSLLHFLGDFLGKETDFHNKVLSPQRLITPLSFEGTEKDAYFWKNE